MPVLRLFASAREAAGVARAEFPGSTVAEMLDGARATYGERFSAVVARSRIWVNGEPASPETAVQGHDVVAVLPPVSGGAGGATTADRTARRPAGAPGGDRPPAGDRPPGGDRPPARNAQHREGRSGRPVSPSPGTAPPPTPRPAQAPPRGEARSVMGGLGGAPDGGPRRRETPNDSGGPPTRTATPNGSGGPPTRTATPNNSGAAPPRTLSPDDRGGPPTRASTPVDPGNRSPSRHQGRPTARRATNGARAAAPGQAKAAPADSLVTMRDRRGMTRSTRTATPETPSPAKPSGGKPSPRKRSSGKRGSADLRSSDKASPGRTAGLGMGQLAVVYRTTRPHGRIGVLWAIVTVAITVQGQAWLAGWLSVIAFVGASQAAGARRAIGQRPPPALAAVLAAAAPIAAPYGVRYVVAVVGGGLVLAMVTGALGHGRGPRDLAVAMAVGAVLGAAAAGPVLTRDLGNAPVLFLFACMAIYDAGAYLVGTGASSAWEGPVAGMVALIPVTLIGAIILSPPYPSGTPLGLGALAACLAPLGPLVGTALVGSREADAPGLRRLDSLILLGPVWAWFSISLLR